MIDRVKLPDVKPGKYVLGWRWDCEQTPQIWQGCSDVTITTAGASFKRRKASTPAPSVATPAPTQECKKSAVVGSCMGVGCFRGHGDASCYGLRCICNPGACSIDGWKCVHQPYVTALSSDDTSSQTSLVAVAVFGGGIVSAVGVMMGWQRSRRAVSIAQAPLLG